MNEDEECERFTSEMMNHNTDNIPNMNNIIHSQHRWDEYPTIRAYNEFANSGGGYGVTRVAYAKIKKLLGVYRHGGVDTLISSTHY